MCVLYYYCFIFMCVFRAKNSHEIREDSQSQKWFMCVTIIDYLFVTLCFQGHLERVKSNYEMWEDSHSKKWFMRVLCCYYLSSMCVFI